MGGNAATGRNSALLKFGLIIFSSGMLISTPGSSFAYSTGNSHLLAAALENATGMGELEFAHKNLFDALGMTSVVWGMDPQGVADGGNGIAMTVQDAARFGQLYLQGGQWNGEQLIPAQWVEQSTTAKNNGSWRWYRFLRLPMVDSLLSGL